MVRLGNKVIDKVTGFKGVAISVTRYLNGCTQWGVQPEAREGKLPKVEYIDEPQLKVIKPEKERKPHPDDGGGGGIRSHPE